MNEKKYDLKAKFTEDFFNEFKFDSEFRTLFESMTRGLTPYEVIEYLCKSKKELYESLKELVENIPRKIIITTEQFERMKNNP